jgi:hypothetical protein
MIKVLLETKCGCSKIIELPKLKKCVDVLIPSFPSHYRTFEMRSEKKDGMPYYVESKTERVKPCEEIADNAAAKKDKFFMGHVTIPASIPFAKDRADWSEFMVKFGEVIQSHKFARQLIRGEEQLYQSISRNRFSSPQNIPQDTCDYLLGTSPTPSTITTAPWGTPAILKTTEGVPSSKKGKVGKLRVKRRKARNRAAGRSER